VIGALLVMTSMAYYAWLKNPSMQAAHLLSNNMKTAPLTLNRIRRDCGLSTVASEP